MNIQRLTTLTAALQVANIFAGDPFEYPTQPTLVSMGVLADTDGALITVTVGARLLMVESPPAFDTTDRFPRIPDEMFYTFIAMPMERIVVSARNPTAGTILLRSLVQLQAAK